MLPRIIVLIILSHLTMKSPLQAMKLTAPINDRTGNVINHNSDNTLFHYVNYEITLLRQ